MGKLTRKQGIKIAEGFIADVLPTLEWFKNIKSEVNAIIFYGSTAKGENRPDSDIDLLIILPLEFETKFTKGEYFYDFKGREINIVLRSIERLRKLADEGYNEFEAEVFRKSEILWANDSEVEELIKKLSSKG